MVDSVWRWTPEYDLQFTPLGAMSAAGELPAIAWAREVKPLLVELQASAGIPAAGAVAQMIHEAWNPGGWTLSRLAAEYHNFAGMKWAEWQRQHGGRPVSLKTWEEVDGQPVDLVDAFAAYPSFAAFLGAYAELLKFPRYRGALAYAAQPLLWLHQVWASGWATDSRYLGGLGHWMTATWPVYQDTVTPPAAPTRAVDILDAGDRLLATGWLMDPDGPGPEGTRTVARVADLADGLGMAHRWDGSRPRPAVTLIHPGVEGGSQE